MPLLKEETYTIDDIYALPDGERAELIDGHMYMMAPPSRKHQRISTRLVSIIDRYIEEYKGKNIVYSLGNFCFGGNNAPSDMDSMIFQQTFTISNDGVKADNVTNIIPCSISSAYGYNNYQPTPAEGDEKTRIMEKIQERSSWIG